MHQTIIASLFLLMLGFSSGCQQFAAPPSDLRLENLNPIKAVEEADLILLAYPVAQRDVAKLTFRAVGNGEPLKLLESETTLDVVRVIKGPALPSQIRFQHYRPWGEKMLAGPPRGPSGPMLSRGIFFLDRRPEGVFRSVVDLYRPFIPTPWILKPVDQQPCARPRDCIARLLMTYNPPDDAEVFCDYLHWSVPISQLLIGYLNTVELLSDLVSVTHPEDVRRQACLETAKRYPLELPSPCTSLLSGSSVEEEYISAAAKLRDDLAKGGVPWIRQRIGAESDGPTRYLELLAKSSDVETRSLAERMLKSLR